MQEILTGTVKGPGEHPHEFTFITTDNVRRRIGEYVYYHAQSGENEWCNWRVIIAACATR